MIDGALDHARSIIGVGHVARDGMTTVADPCRGFNEWALAPSRDGDLGPTGSEVLGGTLSDSRTAPGDEY
jgi:hypothetical protein